MPEELDIAIVGAGAAGLMAAIFAGRAAQQSNQSLRIAALDSAPKIGAKILIAGGGRCNVTHDVIHPADDFNGHYPRLISRVLKTFDVPPTVEFFRELGVELKREETGKLFPTTDSAQTILTALLQATATAGVEIKTNHRVTAISPAACGLALLTATNETILTRRLILATGGKSLPKTGSDGTGYALAQSLGHTVTRTTPALVPLVLPDNHWLTKLTGISVEAELALATATGKILHRQTGPILFTHFGLSGPAVMDISRHWIALHETTPGPNSVSTSDNPAPPDIAASAAMSSPRLTANLLPGQSFNQVESTLLDAVTSRPHANVSGLLRKWFPERLADALARHAAALDPQTPLSHLTKPARRALAHALTALPLPVTRDRGYLFAEVTAGGIPLTEINPATMQSRLCPNLYLCGEILDADGRIGGYNFQWAWASGRLAGMNAGELK